MYFMYDKYFHEKLANQSFLRALRLQHQEQPGRLSPVPELRSVVKKAPTASNYLWPESNSSKDRSTIYYY